MLKNEFKEAVERNIMSVRFTKLDGEERIMTCTRNLNFLPVGMVQTMSLLGHRDEPQQEPRFLRVYDLDNRGWRSIIPDNIISASVIEYDLNPAGN